MGGLTGYLTFEPEHEPNHLSHTLIHRSEAMARLPEVDYHMMDLKREEAGASLHGAKCRSPFCGVEFNTLSSIYVTHRTANGTPLVRKWCPSCYTEIIFTPSPNSQDEHEVEGAW